MSQHLLREIDRIKLHLISLAATVEQSIRHVMRAVFERDVPLATNVIERDKQIDQTEVEIEEECLKVLALYQPVATDLRFIITVIKVNSELERIGDEAKNIAERAITLSEFESVEPPGELREMCKFTETMLRRSLDALINMDAPAARRIREEDDEVDDRNRIIFTRMQDEMRDNPSLVGPNVQIMSISKGLERIADLATNISEEVIYLAEGHIARHPRLFAEGRRSASGRMPSAPDHG